MWSTAPLADRAGGLGAHREGDTSPFRHDRSRNRRQIRGLVWTLVRTDFKTRYHGTWGGFVWALAKPLTMFVMLMGVFSYLFASDPTYKLNLIIGLFLWDFFAEGTKAGLGSLDAKRFLLTKARCPSWIIVVTSISNAVITLSVFIVIIIAFLIGVGRAPSPVAVAWFLVYADGPRADRHRVLAGVECAVSALPGSQSGVGFDDAGGIFRRAGHLSHWHSARAISHLSLSVGANADHRIHASGSGPGTPPTLRGDAFLFVAVAASLGVAASFSVDWRLARRSISKIRSRRTVPENNCSPDHPPPHAEPT